LSLSRAVVLITRFLVISICNTAGGIQVQYLQGFTRFLQNRPGITDNQLPFL